MFKRLLEAFTQPLGRIGVLIALLALLSVGVWGILQTQAAPQQPIQFPHKLHVGLGITALPCLASCRSHRPTPRRPSPPARGARPMGWGGF